MKKLLIQHNTYGYLIIFILLFTACKNDSYKSGFESNYGDDSYELVKRSRKIYYFELNPYYEDTATVARVGDYVLISEKEPLEKVDKKKIKQMLTVYNSYHTDGLNWACTFNPTFGLEFRQKNQKAYLVISPECAKAKFWIDGKNDVHFIDYSLLVNDIEAIFKE